MVLPLEPNSGESTVLKSVCSMTLPGVLSVLQVFYLVFSTGSTV